MVTKKIVKRVAPRRAKEPDLENNVVDKIKQVHLEDAADREYYEYGVAVIEDRAIFGSLDGLKPVLRRVLWATHKLGLHSGAKPDKSAKAVGETLGNYHPHGDKACYDAIVNAVSNVPIPMIYGEGNWGTMTEGAAAMRYTNMRLSKYADLVFFDKFYLPTMGYVPNYDGSRQEPLVLPALLPNALLNGNFGIAPGVNTRSPTFTLASLMEVLKEAIANKNICTPEMCMKLVFSTPHGGKAVRTKANRAEILAFFKGGKGRVKFTSTHGEPDSNNAIRFDEFAPIANMEGAMLKIEDLKGVIATRDDSDKKDKHQTAFVVTFAKNLRGADLTRVIAQVNEALSTTYTFDVKVTDRFVKPDGTAGAKLRPTTVPDLITFWLAYRVALEKNACEYWIKERTKDIAYLELMRLAISKLDVIIAHVKNRKLDDAGLVKAVSRDLKITDDQTNQVLARNLRQLRHLEDQKLLDQIKAIQTERASYEVRMKRPSAYIAKHLEELQSKIK